jgi:hypothetical protein
MDYENCCGWGILINEASDDGLRQRNLNDVEAFEFNVWCTCI